MTVRSTSDSQVRNATLPVAPRDEATRNTAAEREADAKKTPLAVGTTTTSVPVDSVSTTPGINPASELVAGVGNILPPPFPPPAAAQENHQRSLASYTSNLDVALTGAEGKSAASMSADELFAAFMKLNALGDTDDLKNQDDLAAAASKLQQLAIENAKQAIKTAQENLAKAEKEQSMWKGISGMLEACNPLYSVCKACGVSQDILGYIDPVANACEPLANGGAAVDAAKAELECATKCLDELGKTDWQRLAQLLADYEAQQKAETGSADETGVPTKGLTAGLKAAAGKAAAALSKIGEEQGFAAMVGAMPNAIRDAVLPVLQENGVKNAELIATMLGIQVAMDTTAKALANGPDEGMAVLTMMLGALLATDAASTSPKAPTAAAATAAALETLRSFSTETVATTNKNSGTRG